MQDMQTVQVQKLFFGDIHEANNVFAPGKTGSGDRAGSFHGFPRAEHKEAFHTCNLFTVANSPRDEAEIGSITPTAGHMSAFFPLDDSITMTWLTGTFINFPFPETCQQMKCHSEEERQNLFTFSSTTFTSLHKNPLFSHFEKVSAPSATWLLEPGKREFSVY